MPAPASIAVLGQARAVTDGREMSSQQLELPPECCDIVRLSASHVDSGSVLLVKVLVFVTLRVLYDIYSAFFCGRVCSWPVQPLQEKFTAK